MTTKNVLYPGLPNYTGPTKGFFTLLHHQGPLLEWSSDVTERIDYIKQHKFDSEVPIRLRHIVAYPEKLWSKKLQKASAEWEKTYAEWKKASAEWKKAYAEWEKAYAEWQKASAEWKKASADKILAYLKKHVKHCKWNGKELVFP